VTNQKARLQIGHVGKAGRHGIQGRLRHHPRWAGFAGDNRFPGVVRCCGIEALIGRAEKQLGERWIDDASAPAPHRLDRRGPRGQAVEHDRRKAKRCQARRQRYGLTLNAIRCATPVPTFERVEERRLERGGKAEAHHQSRANFTIGRDAFVRNRLHAQQQARRLEWTRYSGAPAQGPQKAERLARNASVDQVAQAAHFHVIARETGEHGGGSRAAHKPQQGSVVRVPQLRVRQTQAPAEVCGKQACSQTRTSSGRRSMHVEYGAFNRRRRRTCAKLMMERFHRQRLSLALAAWSMAALLLRALPGSARAARYLDPGTRLPMHVAR